MNQEIQHPSSYESVMRLSRNRTYHFAGKTYDWLDVVHACYLVQMRLGQYKYWDANTVTSDLRQLRPGHGWFPGLSLLVSYGILKVTRMPVGIGKKTEPQYYVIDPSGVALALNELRYLDSKPADL